VHVERVGRAGQGELRVLARRGQLHASRPDASVARPPWVKSGPMSLPVVLALSASYSVNGTLAPVPPGTLNGDCASTAGRPSRPGDRRRGNRQRERRAERGDDGGGEGGHRILGLAAALWPGGLCVGTCVACLSLRGGKCRLCQGRWWPPPRPYATARQAREPRQDPGCGWPPSPPPSSPRSARRSRWRLPRRRIAQAATAAPPYWAQSPFSVPGGTGASVPFTEYGREREHHRQAHRPGLHPGRPGDRGIGREAVQLTASGQYAQFT